MGWLVNRIRDRALVIDRLPNVDVSSDPADNFLLGMAAAGAADYLVTGDRSGVLAIGRYHGTNVVTVSEMVSKLELE